MYRALATANEAVKLGFRVTVLTAEHATFARYTGTDESLESLVDPAVNVVRIPFRWPARDIQVSGDGSVADQWRRVQRKLAAMGSRVLFPETHYGSWRGPLNRAALAIHEADPVHLTIATANPNVTFAAAYDLFRRRGVPYVLDQRDAWLLNIFSGETTQPRWSRQARWEQRMVAEATELWFVNSQIRDWHRRRYPQQAERMEVVRNGWDANLLGPVSSMPAEQRPPVFGYLGTISAQVPIAELAQAWSEATSDLPANSQLIIAGHAGYFADSDSRVSTALATAAQQGVQVRGPVPKREVGEYYSELDILVMAIGSGLYVTSGKVYEYVATAKPIVAICPPDNPAAEVLQGYPGVAQVQSTDPAAIREALISSWHLWQRSSDADIDARREVAGNYRRERVLQPALARALTYAQERLAQTSSAAS